MDYLPFGETRSGGWGTTHKFTGDERDSETGLDHTLFRQYSSSLGRWSSPDPLAGDISDPQSLNRYSYVGNNPLAYVDPLGASDCDPDGQGAHPCPALMDGGDGFGCTLDGISTSCGYVSHLANGPSMSAVQCPNNDCSGIYYFNSSRPGGDVFRSQYKTTWQIFSALSPSPTGDTLGGLLTGRWAMIYIGSTHQCGDFLCDPAGNWLNVFAPGMQEDVGVEYAVAGLVAGGAGVMNRLAPATVEEPVPPGWNPNWQKLPSSRSGPGWSWWDEKMGEWRFHGPDSWHPDAHWDYNPWSEWNSPWRNIPIKK